MAACSATSSRTRRYEIDDTDTHTLIAFDDKRNVTQHVIVDMRGRGHTVGVYGPAASAAEAFAVVKRGGDA